MHDVDADVSAESDRRDDEVAMAAALDRLEISTRTLVRSRPPLALRHGRNSMVIVHAAGTTVLADAGHDPGSSTDAWRCRGPLAKVGPVEVRMRSRRRPRAMQHAPNIESHEDDFDRYRGVFRDFASAALAPTAKIRADERQERSIDGRTHETAPISEARGRLGLTPGEIAHAVTFDGGPARRVTDVARQRREVRGWL